MPGMQLGGGMADAPYGYGFEVCAKLPGPLQGLEVLANNLAFSWDRRIRGLFFRMDSVLWERCEHNPKVFLRYISQARLEHLAADAAFLEEYHHVLALFADYESETKQVNPRVQSLMAGGNMPVIAYFCTEYGFHESLPLYSGGLGVLAGDHLKASSDLGVPLVAVGLMYRQGYFTQTIGLHGEQEAHHIPTNLNDLPIEPVTEEDGNERRLGVPFPGRIIWCRIWEARIGHVRLYLLDTDVAENDHADRAITYQLYGGDHANRIAQELVLGVGGVRVLRALDIHPGVWHMNEGHAAFVVLERCREMMAAGLDLPSALEAVASSQVFTTHTPVPAGHDKFDRMLALRHLEPLAAEMAVSPEQLFALGATKAEPDLFNMTALALRGSRFRNGVSRVHRDVAAHMLGFLWPEIDPAENPMGCVTNGVHLPTFLAREWGVRFDMRFQGWRGRKTDQAFWNEAIQGISDYEFFSLRQGMKAEMLEDVRRRLLRQGRRNRIGMTHLERMTARLTPANDVLVLGFARRFATYKRATLLFHDSKRLTRLLSDPERPVVLIFAGKARPQDKAGQSFIKTITTHAHSPEFLGKVFFVEGYDLALARKLVTGCDVWLNCPRYPQEASGTSGQKAAMNGVLNLSVLDGWWAEGYDGHNGWAVQPAVELGLEERDAAEAEEFLDLLEDQVIPLYFTRGSQGYPKGWVHTMKHAMVSTLARFNAERMVLDYLRDFYIPAFRLGSSLCAHQGEGAKELASWRQRIDTHWPNLQARLIRDHGDTFRHGDLLQLQVAVDLDGLKPQDLCVEAVMARDVPGLELRDEVCYRFEPQDSAAGEMIFKLAIPLLDNGRFTYRIRLFPTHPKLSHPFETGYTRWL